MAAALDGVPHRFPTERRQSIAASHFVSPHLPPSEHQPGSGVGNLSHPILSRIVRNNSRETATSAIWKITCRAWRTTFAPILISFSRSVVSVQCRTACGSTACRRKLPKLYASTNSCNRTWLSTKS